MATAPAPTELTAGPVAGVQPGGHGPFVRAELRLAALRRAFLRRFRPGYVRAAAARLRGDKSACPYDVVDARDLKYWRNVSPCWFDPADDPWLRTSAFGFARYGLAELVGFSLMNLAAAALVTLGAAAVHPLVALLLIPVAFWQFEVVWFFRDPRRVPPADPAAVVSPADGTVTHVEEVDEPGFGRAVRVSIFLSVFNVHVNRSPRAAEVTAVRHFPGAYLDARHADCARRNEQLWLDLREPGGRPLRVKQVAGAIARRIVCWPRVGETLRAGDRYGMIKFGSRTDVLWPAETAADVLVKVGDTVKGGLTVLARFKE